MIKIVSTAIAVAVFVVGMIPAKAVEKLTVGNAQIVVKTVTGELATDRRTIQLLDDIYHNELIETGEASAAELVFLDDTKLALGPNSSLVIDRFVYNPEPDQAAFVATATSGAFRFVSGKLSKNSYIIHTPTATIGVRGTVFSFVVLPADPAAHRIGAVVNVTVEEGTAIVTGCTGQQVLLDRSGLSTTVSQTVNGTCMAPSAPAAQPAEFSSMLTQSWSRARLRP